MPVPNDGKVGFEDTGSSEDLLPTPVPVADVRVAVIEEFPAGDRAVVDGKRLVKLVLTPELVGPEVGAIRVDEFPAEDGKIEVVLDAVPAPPLDVTSGTLSVGLGTRVEEKLENGNGAEEKSGPEVGTAVLKDIVPDGLKSLEVRGVVDVALGSENMAGTEVGREAVKDVEFIAWLLLALGGVLVGPTEGAVVFANSVELGRRPIWELLLAGTTLPVPNAVLVEFSAG